MLFPRTGSGWILEPNHDDPVVAQEIRCCARHTVMAFLMRTDSDHLKPVA